MEVRLVTREAYQFTVMCAADVVKRVVQLMDMAQVYIFFLLIIIIFVHKKKLGQICVL